VVSGRLFHYFAASILGRLAQIWLRAAFVFFVSPLWPAFLNMRGKRSATILKKSLSVLTDPVDA